VQQHTPMRPDEDVGSFLSLVVFAQASGIEQWKQHELFVLLGSSRNSGSLTNEYADEVVVNTTRLSQDNRK
jgi:hypothetical protein